MVLQTERRQYAEDKANILEGEDDVPVLAYFSNRALRTTVVSYFFKEGGLAQNNELKKYFIPLKWTTILITAAAISCALEDYIENGIKPRTVTEFSQENFSGKFIDFVDYTSAHAPSCV